MSGCTTMVLVPPAEHHITLNFSPLCVCVCVAEFPDLLCLIPSLSVAWNHLAVPLMHPPVFISSCSWLSRHSAWHSLLLNFEWHSPRDSVRSDYLFILLTVQNNLEIKPERSDLRTQCVFVWLKGYFISFRYLTMFLLVYTSPQKKALYGVRVCSLGQLCIVLTCIKHFLNRTQLLVHLYFNYIRTAFCSLCKFFCLSCHVPIIWPPFVLVSPSKLLWISREGLVSLTRHHTNKYNKTSITLNSL